MSLFGKRMKNARELTGFSQRALSKKVGVTNATISNWENGVTDPANIKRDVMDALAKQLRVSVSHLLDGETSGQPLRTTETEPIHEEFEEDEFDPVKEVRLAVYDIEVSGGPGSQVPEFVETKEHFTFKRSWLKKIRAIAEDIRIVTVSGNSMEPVLWNGDKLAIHTGRTKIREGKVFALAYNNEARVKRLYLQVDGRLRIASDNLDKARFPDEYLAGEELDRVKIIGQAVHRMGDGGL